MTPPAGPVIRPAALGDAGAIARIERDLFAAEAWSEAQVADELSGYGRRGWVVVAASAPDEASSPGAEALAGYVIMRTVGDVSDLQRIAVVADGQRAGLASRLLATACAGVRKDGAERVLLEVAEDNAAARSLYAKRGFVEIDRRPRYYRTGADALVLALDLD